MKQVTKEITANELVGDAIFGPAAAGQVFRERRVAISTDNDEIRDIETRALRGRAPKRRAREVGRPP